MAREEGKPQTPFQIPVPERRPRVRGFRVVMLQAHLARAWRKEDSVHVLE